MGGLKRVGLVTVQMSFFFYNNSPNAFFALFLFIGLFIL
jgi:hypothetical protein